MNTSNFEKYQTKNPVVRKLIANFNNRLRDELKSQHFESFLDAGCGEGMTLAALHDLLPERVHAFDANFQSIEIARQKNPGCSFSVANVYSLPWNDDSFDLTLCCEVLEHLEKPERAIEELCRVTKQTLILSVPYEPWFRLGSFFRGKYLKTLGNHPEHIQNWNLNSFSHLLRRFSPSVKTKISFPWIQAVCSLNKQEARKSS
jgi:ubiquinone/menaquinone biosynthesis C-methylase UbiE